MSLPRYPKYKDSGVEWLGEVPEHWDLRRLKFLCDIQTGGRDTENAIEEGMYPFFVRSQTVERIDSYAFDCEAVLTAGDGAGVGKVFHYHVGPFDFHQRVYMLNNFRRASGRFIFHFLRENFYKVALEGGAKSTVDSLRRPMFTNFPVPVPSPAEQLAITGFVEHESEKIDSLVSEQQRLMELLKEKRQAVISHAVTKGLNPDAPTKPSGVEWLGPVPETWSVGPLKRFIAPRPGAIKTGPFGSHLTAAEMSSGTIKVYNQRNVIDSDIEGGESYISDEKFLQLSSFEVFPGDLLVTTRGTIGRAVILPRGSVRGILHPCVMRIQADESRLRGDFLMALIVDSNLLRSQLQYLSNATTIDVIYSETMASVTIPVPTPAEQEAILEYLKVETAKLDALTAEAQRAIDLLQERRTALISAAVTGQIDVRDLA